MQYKKIFYIGLFFLGILGGCGLNEGVVQKEPKSFLWFTGNTQNAEVHIDDLNPFILNNANGSKVYYEISPGNHSIIVMKSGEEIINRNVLLGNGITKEIKIP